MAAPAYEAARELDVPRSGRGRVRSQTGAFYVVGLWYDDFTQTTDEEVHDLIVCAARAFAAAASASLGVGAFTPVGHGTCLRAARAEVTGRRCPSTELPYRR